MSEVLEEFADFGTLDWIFVGLITAGALLFIIGILKNS